MSVATPETSSRLPQPIESLLAQLRRRIRSYIWAHGLAAIVLLIGAGFWISLAFDWLFEPPAAMRLLAMVGFGLALVYAVAAYLVARVFVPLKKRNLALLVERKFGDFGESLLTTVELAEEPEWHHRYSGEMVMHTREQAVRSLDRVQIAQVLNLRPLVRMVGAAMLIMASVVAFGVLAQNAFGIWARRSLMLSPEIWPRKTRLIAEGFHDGRIKVARGSDLRLVVKADAAKGRDVPESVYVRWTDAGGTRNREAMSRSGVAVPGVDAFQNYNYSFKSILAPLQLYVQGGDDRLGPLAVEVVESPTLAKITAHCIYPAYMARQPRDLAASGMLLVPRGCELAILAQSNKPVVAVQIDESYGEKAFRTVRLDFADQPTDRFRYRVDKLMQERTLLFTLLDTDNIRSREPVRLELAVRPDEAPEVNMALEGISTAITPQAHLPARGEISDDYGIAEAWFEYRIADTAARRQQLVARKPPQNKMPLDESFEVAALDLKPKQKLQLAVRAADNYRLAASGPNVSSSQSYSLDVVTPADLRAILESRELMLRRRLETIIEEFTQTRGTLASLDFGPLKSAAPEGATAVVAGQPPTAARSPAAAGLELRKVQAERVLQNTERAAHEVREVALAFDEIREELINNRVDTEELKKRLKIGISDPLKRVANVDLAQLRSALRQMEKQLADLDAGPTTRHAATRQADAVLTALKGVLEQMLEMESFGEVVEMLRDIISAQEKVIDATKRAQRDQLRDLIED